MSPQSIHLIAIGGMGVGALALLLKKQGHAITGSDLALYPPMSTQLEKNRIPVFSGFSTDHLKNRPDLVIIGNAVSRDNPEVKAVLEKKIPYLSLPQAISRYLIKDKKAIVIAGTHGKTTTTALMAHLLKEIGEDSSYFVGGVIGGNESETVGIHEGKGKYCVIEGDEYDSAFFDKGPKFLHYKPTYTVITSLEFDHADIYNNLEEIKNNFEKLVAITDPQGLVLACDEYPILDTVLSSARCQTITYGLDSLPPVPSSPLIGRHNALNTAACFTLLRHLGFAATDLQKALMTFPGVKRRQEVIASINNIVIIDDFAHHPTAVKETLRAVREKYPEHTLWAVFEPRSNTSKRDVFQKDYATAFTEADYTVIADVFMPEKVKDGKVLDVERLAADITANGNPARPISGVDAIIETLVREMKPKAVCLIMSNGGFGGIHGKLVEKLGGGKDSSLRSE